MTISPATPCSQHNVRWIFFLRHFVRRTLLSTTFNPVNISSSNTILLRTLSPTTTLKQNKNSSYQYFAMMKIFLLLSANDLTCVARRFVLECRSTSKIEFVRNIWYNLTKIKKNCFARFIVSLHYRNPRYFFDEFYDPDIEPFAMCHDDCFGLT